MVALAAPGCGLQLPTDAMYTVTELLRDLSDRNALVLDTSQVNTWLGPKLLELLASSDDLSQLLQEKFDWDWSLQAFNSPGPTMDLAKLKSCLQKYLYERLPGQLGAGSYSVVYKARNRETNELLAIKKLNQSSDGGFMGSAIREISILQELQHENIVQLRDVITSAKNPHVYLVLEYLDCDLRKYLSNLNVPMDIACVKGIMHQIIKGLEYVHSHCVLHRDLKPENVLIDRGTQTVKLTDFGLARQYLPSDQAYTGKIVTLYYRSPELLLGMGHYSTAVDLWSVGCIFAEVVNLEPLFCADNESGLLLKILETLGTPTLEQWPGFRDFHAQLPFQQGKDIKDVCPRLADDPQALDLLSQLLNYNPAKRITARQALAHPWFGSFDPATEYVAVISTAPQGRLPAFRGGLDAPRCSWLQ